MSIFNVEYNNIKSLYKIRTRFDLLWVILNIQDPGLRATEEWTTVTFYSFYLTKKLFGSLLYFI